MKRIKIVPFIVEVTAQDIKRGVPSEGDSCPIALALKRIGFKNSQVDYHVVTVTKGSGRNETEIKFDLPARANKFTRNFDVGVTVKPFKFTVRRFTVRPLFGVNNPAV